MGSMHIVHCIKRPSICASSIPLIVGLRSIRPWSRSTMTSEAISKEKHGVWDPMPELTITSPFVDSTTFTMGNPMQESTWTLCQSRLYPPVRDWGFGLCMMTHNDLPWHRLSRRTDQLAVGSHILPQRTWWSLRTTKRFFLNEHLGITLKYCNALKRIMTSRRRPRFLCNRPYIAATPCPPSVSPPPIPLSLYSLCVAGKVFLS